MASETMALSHCSLFRPPPRWKTCRIGITGLPAGSVSRLDGSRFIKHIRFEQAGEELIRKVPDHKRHSRDKCPAWRHLSPWEYDHFVPFLFSNNILEHQAPGNVRIIQQGAKLWYSIISAKYTSLAHQKQKNRRTKEDHNYSLAGSQNPHSWSGMHMKITKDRAQWSDSGWQLLWHVLGKNWRRQASFKDPQGHWHPGARRNHVSALTKAQQLEMSYRWGVAYTLFSSTAPSGISNFTPDLAVIVTLP